MATVVKSFSIQGIDAYPVDIEITRIWGQVPLNSYKIVKRY